MTDMQYVCAMNYHIISSLMLLAIGHFIAQEKGGDQYCKKVAISKCPCGYTVRAKLAQ